MVMVYIQHVAFIVSHRRHGIIADGTPAMLEGKHCLKVFEGEMMFCIDLAPLALQTSGTPCLLFGFCLDTLFLGTHATEMAEMISWAGWALGRLRYDIKEGMGFIVVTLETILLWHGHPLTDGLLDKRYAAAGVKVVPAFGLQTLAAHQSIAHCIP
jgi:hypothetical protein